LDCLTFVQIPTLKILGIIPARYGSSRFPGKPLAMIRNKPMIQWVYEQALKAKSLSGVLVATDDQRITDTVKGFGGQVVMTAGTHTNGTSRCLEVLEQLQKTGAADFDCIINIQGDEPLIHPEQIDELACLFDHPDAEIVTQAIKEPTTDIQNTNIVKVYVNEQGYATDFSRTAGHIREPFYLKHIGIYGYRTAVLPRIVALPLTENELSRQLEQMRWLDHHVRIRVGTTQHESISVDLPEDIDKIMAYLDNQI
jgi:3-deoxy-manno-octulosonate cytidylyltransferase (CMP-KDO synthetase)